MRSFTKCAYLLQQLAVSSSTFNSSFNGMVFDLIELDQQRMGIPAFGGSAESRGYVELTLTPNIFDHMQEALRIFAARSGQALTHTANLVNISGHMSSPLELVRDFNSFDSAPVGRFANWQNYGSIVLAHDTALRNHYSSAFISMSPRSTPDGGRSLQLAFAPSDVNNQFCHEGSIWYAPIVPDDFIRLRARVSLVVTVAGYAQPATILGSTSEAENFTLSFNDKISVPQRVYDEIARTIRANMHMSLSEFERHPECETMINRFPTIRYSILNTSETALVDVHIEPPEYISVSDGDARRCQINIMDPARPARIIGRPLFESVGVHIDYAHQRVGFCDPL